MTRYDENHVQLIYYVNCWIQNGQCKKQSLVFLTTEKSDFSSFRDLLALLHSGLKGLAGCQLFSLQRNQYWTHVIAKICTNLFAPLCDTEWTNSSLQKQSQLVGICWPVEHWQSVQPQCWTRKYVTTTNPLIAARALEQGKFRVEFQPVVTTWPHSFSLQYPLPISRRG